MAATIYPSSLYETRGTRDIADERRINDDQRERGVAGRAWGFVLVVFAASRLSYLVAGALLAPVVPIHPFQSQTSGIPFGTLAIGAHFDGELYLSVAESGYEDDSPVFFPLYPLLVRGVVALIGGPISWEALSTVGVLVSLAAFLFALYFVYRIAEEGWGARVAEGAVRSLAFFPTSFFFNAVYKESLFLALSAGAVWAVWVRKDLLLARLLAGLAAATRNVGVLLLFPLVAEWSEHRRYNWRIAYLALVPAGLVTYMVYLRWRFGDPLLFYGEQARWGREPKGMSGLPGAFQLANEDLLSLVDPAVYDPFGFESLVYVLSGTNHLYSLLFLLFAVTVLVARRKLLSADLFWAYTLAILLVPVLFASVVDPLMSMPRFILAASPLFIVLGATVLKDRRVLVGWLLASITVSLAFVALFVGWYFVA